MKSLILFFINLVLLRNSTVSGSFVEPQSSSIFYVDNEYNIQWEASSINNNISHIFLTHSDPFKLSKFSNNQMVLSDNINLGETNYIWNIPYELNHYNVTPILWRILLSNSSTPYSGNIGSHTENNLIILSDFFKIKSNMNISTSALLDSDQSIYRFNEYNFTTAGFTDDFNVDFFMTNRIINTSIANFTANNTNFSNNFLEVNNFLDNSLSGNYPRQFTFTLKSPEEIYDNFDLNYLRIKVSQNNIIRVSHELPIVFIYLTKEYVSDFEVKIRTTCINKDSCNYNLHIIHNDNESVIHNLQQNEYVLNTQVGDYIVFATIPNIDETNEEIKSNSIYFDVTTPTTTTTTTTKFLPTTTLLTTLVGSTSNTLTEYYNGTLNTCNEDDDCNDNTFTIAIVFLVLAIISFICAWYYYFKIYKKGKHNKVYPKLTNSRKRYSPTNGDLEMGGNRALPNPNYFETESGTKETSFYGDPDQDPINNYQPKYVYSNTERIYPNLKDLEDESNTRNGAIVNEIYSRNFKPSLHIKENENNVNNEYTNYFDNYGFKRQIRRRHSSGSFTNNYAYPVLPPDFVKEIKNDDYDRYNHLARKGSFVEAKDSNYYNSLEPQIDNSSSSEIRRKVTKREQKQLFEGPSSYGY